MDDQPTSGNRWERPADRPAPAADETTEAPVMPQRGSTGDAAATPPPRRDWRASLARSRMQLAGAALVVFLVGGGAGFAVGSTTGDGQDEHGSFPGGFPGSVPGGGHLGDDDGFGSPPGGLPGEQQGQQPDQQQPFGQDDGAGT